MDPSGRLALVGLGIGPKGISLAGLEAARSVDHVFLESYTARPPEPAAALEELLGKEVTVVDRAAVEGQVQLLEAARDGGACLLVVGDPLSATTHTALQLTARQEGLEVEVHFGASILTAAAGTTGLSHYKFGRTTTLVTPRGDYFPTSPYEAVVRNREQGLHTLVLLDIREDGSCMTGPEGARLLLDLEERCQEGVLGPETVAALVARVGSPDQAAYHGPLEGLAALEAGEPMHALVVPGEMSEFEEEALRGLTRSTDGA